MRYALLLLLFATTGCTTSGKPVPSGNTDVEVKLIATFDGIRLYQVETTFDRVFVADARPNSVATNWTEAVNKIHHSRSVTTVAR